MTLHEARYHGMHERAGALGRCLRRRAGRLTLIACAGLSGIAQAYITTNLQNAGVEDLYGRYAPHGDCKRSPRITVDAGGFTFDYAGSATHSAKFDYVASAYSRGGPVPKEYASLHDFFLFVTGEHAYDADFTARIVMTGDTSKNSLTLVKAGQPPGQRLVLTPLQTALVRHSPYIRCGKPQPHSVSKTVKPPTHAPPVAVDWNNLPALVGKYQFDFDFYHNGPIAARLKALLGDKLKTLESNMDVSGPLRRAGDIYYLSGNAPHRGGEDQAYVLMDATRRAVQVGLWDQGKLTTYRSPGEPIAPPPAIRKLLDASPPEDAVAEPGVPWQARPIPGHSPRVVAIGVAAASPNIQSLSVFCDRGRPLLALLLHHAPASVPLTFTIIFRGWLVNVPMTRDNNDATLWLADLSASQLPRMLTRPIDIAFLRLNSDLQGQVAMAGSVAATRAALAGCYRY